MDFYGEALRFLVIERNLFHSGLALSSIFPAGDPAIEATSRRVLLQDTGATYTIFRNTVGPGIIIFWNNSSSRDNSSFRGCRS